MALRNVVLYIRKHWIILPLSGIWANSENWVGSLRSKVATKNSPVKASIFLLTCFYKPWILIKHYGNAVLFHWF